MSTLHFSIIRTRRASQEAEVRRNPSKNPNRKRLIYDPTDEPQCQKPVNYSTLRLVRSHREYEYGTKEISYFFRDLNCCAISNATAASEQNERQRSAGSSTSRPSFCFAADTMEPAEIEFLAENQSVTITPNFSYGKIFLVSGEVGPFRAGMPLKVPIWLAVNLKSRQKCRIVAPDWMDVEKLEELKEEESKSGLFCQMPSEYYIVETQLLLNVAEDDIPRSDALRTVIKDIWDKRLAKLRKSVDTFIKVGGTHAKVDHLTHMEINSVKPILPHAIDLLNRMQFNRLVPHSQYTTTPPSGSSIK